jgi:hypothetical protein
MASSDDGGGVDDGEPTLNESLVALSAVLQRAVDAAQGPAFEGPLLERQNETPRTLVECFNLAQNAQAEKESNKKKKADDSRGAPVGGEYLTGAFPNCKEAPFMAWAEEFFRPLRREDVEAALASHLQEPSRDPALRVPALGRHYTVTWQEEEVAAMEEAAAAARDGEPGRRKAGARRATGARTPRASNSMTKLAAHVRTAPPAAGCCAASARHARRAAFKTKLLLLTALPFGPCRATALMLRVRRAQTEPVTTIISPIEDPEPGDLCHVCYDGDRCQLFVLHSALLLRCVAGGRIITLNWPTLLGSLLPQCVTPARTREPSHRLHSPKPQACALRGCTHSASAGCTAPAQRCRRRAYLAARPCTTPDGAATLAAAARAGVRARQ